MPSPALISSPLDSAVAHDNGFSWDQPQRGRLATVVAWQHVSDQQQRGNNTLKHMRCCNGVKRVVLATKWKQVFHINYDSLPETNITN
jgi:hypothetical protein